MTPAFGSQRVVMAAAVLAAVALPAHAQRTDPTRIIVFHLNAERPNVSFSGSMMEGGRFRLTTPDRGTPGWAFSPMGVAFGCWTQPKPLCYPAQ